MLKAFFLLLLAAFGAVMFAAGALAPASVKTSLENFAAYTASLLSADRARLAGASASAKPAASGAAASGAVAATTASGAVYAASTPIANLLVPAPPPTNGHYALQAATFTSRDAAARFADSVAEQGYKATIVPVSDSGQPLIVVIGDYSSPEAASADQLIIGRQLKSTALPPVVLLPPPAH